MPPTVRLLLATFTPFDSKMLTARYVYQEGEWKILLWGSSVAPNEMTYMQTTGMSLSNNPTVKNEDPKSKEAE